MIAANSVQHNSLGKINIDSRDQYRCEYIFAFVRRALGKKTPTQSFSNSKSASPAEKNELFKRIRLQQTNTHIDFSNGDTFSVYDQRYFYRNLYKYILVSLYLQSNYEHFRTYNKICDVGAGSGTFLLAWLMTGLYLRYGRLDGEIVLSPLDYKELTLNDTNGFQNAVSQAAFSRIFRNSIGNIRFSQEDLLKKKGDPSCLYLCGYVLTNIEPNTNIFRFLIGKCVIVDFPEKTREIEALAWKRRRFASTSFSLHSKISSNLIKPIKSVAVEVHSLISGPEVPSDAAHLQFAAE
ncbi:hypothetical protein [Rhizobium leguminosarum]|uniref:hypothetical protein n=1 Tax=Rhizobium leguminosarum TaxID=384 RepID=UPI0012F6B768|nr:hypothetical protein [Rhizobium leguminosarum]